MSLTAYYPHVLVQCEDVEGLVAQGARLVQVDLDPEAFKDGHIEGAISWNWKTQLRNVDSEEILTKEELENLLGSSGIEPMTKVIVYGDNNNWFACWAYWLLHLFGHTNVFLIDGGIKKWIAEGRELSTEVVTYPTTTYVAQDLDSSTKASTENVFESFFSPETHRLVDVRSSAEYEGKLLGPGMGAAATCAVGGHIPTAINIPWNVNCNPDGTFKSPDELREIYKGFDIGPEMNVITYCAVGERASLSWFVLKKLLDYKVVMNYDRSMSYYSRIENAPIVQGEAA